MQRREFLSRVAGAATTVVMRRLFTAAQSTTASMPPGEKNKTSVFAWLGKKGKSPHN